MRTTSESVQNALSVMEPYGIPPHLKYRPTTLADERSFVVRLEVSWSKSDATVWKTVYVTPSMEE